VSDDGILYQIRTPAKPLLLFVRPVQYPASISVNHTKEKARPTKGQKRQWYETVFSIEDTHRNCHSFDGMERERL